MTSSVEALQQIYLGERNCEQEEMNCAAHDIALYKVPPGLLEDASYAHLKEAFNNHPFILNLKELIESQLSKSLRYGGVVSWIQENTTTVPIPRSWEIKEKQIVNILYNWICEFDNSFHWDQPNVSQIIYKNE